MKYLSLFLITIMLYACNKDDDIPQLHSEIYGTWHLKTSMNGIDGSTTNYPEDTGEHIALVIKTNDSLHVILNDKIENSGTYEIIQKESLIYREEKDFIYYKNADNTDTFEFIIKLESDNLIIEQDAYDGLGWLFQR